MIPFDREAFLGVFERYNLDVWPMQIVLCFSAVGVSGASGEYGQSGASGGANGQTPLYDRVGLILLGGVGGGAAQGLTRKAWLPSSQPTKVPSSSSISR
jgi:hypothetical protein